MDDDDEVLIASFCLIFGAFFAVHEQATSSCRRRHTVWVKKYLRNRNTCGYFHSLMPDLKVSDKVRFENFIRMS